MEQIAISWLINTHYITSSGLSYSALCVYLISVNKVLSMRTDWMSLAPEGTIKMQTFCNQMSKVMYWTCWQIIHIPFVMMTVNKSIYLSPGLPTQDIYRTPWAPTKGAAEWGLTRGSFVGANVSVWSWKMSTRESFTQIHIHFTFHITLSFITRFHLRTRHYKYWRIFNFVPQKSTKWQPGLAWHWVGDTPVGSSVKHIGVCWCGCRTLKY